MLKIALQGPLIYLQVHKSFFLINTSLQLFMHIFNNAGEEQLVGHYSESKDYLFRLKSLHAFIL